MAFLIFSIVTHFDANTVTSLPSLLVKVCLSSHNQGALPRCESVQGVSLGLLQQALVYHGPIEPLVDPSGPLHPDLTFPAG